MISINMSQEHYNAIVARLVNLEDKDTHQANDIKYIKQQLDYQIKNMQLMDDRIEELEKIIDEELS